MTDSPDVDALSAVVDSALERALLEASDARRYFALAGAVERAREDAGDPRSDPLTAALVCTVAVSALESTAESEPLVPTWSPPDTRNELVAVGAVCASERFDVDPERVAARAGVPLSDLETRLAKERTEP
ncbi:hypothetical protein NDI76_09840 [Halogeometricum sp. S1BR25-6]|uniref:Uncharacterized protein n=1 Tax=Halogeometricum salsisoli TaxID=2950536 RepID=A0ABU2GE12_9EURY|nr:hypothetical protein [Halogeometricum sp. S1BR25-6]MDS0299045.1 hypothetical protein [Halogeometricum sp. S1BR25-6]